MKLLSTNLKVLVLLFTIFFSFGALAATIESAQTGDWNNPYNWVGCIVPSASVDVTIKADHTVTVTTNQTHAMKSLAINATGALTVAQNAELSVDRTTTTTAFSNAGNVNNSGTIRIGQTIGVKPYGLFNSGTFTNQSTGQIFVDRATHLANNCG